MFAQARAEAFILVGGQAKRLGGRDKGLLLLDGEPLVKRLARHLSAYCTQVTLLGPPEASQGYEDRKARYLEATQGLEVSVSWAADLPMIKRGGSLRALQSAMSHAHQPWLWVLSADLPLLGSEELCALTRGLEAHHLAHLYESEGRLQPLAGLWSKAARGELHKLWSRGAPLQSLRGAPWLKLSHPDSPERLSNLNYPHELEALRRRHPSLRFAWE